MYESFITMVTTTTTGKQQLCPKKKKGKIHDQTENLFQYKSNLNIIKKQRGPKYKSPTFRLRMCPFTKGTKCSTLCWRFNVTYEKSCCSSFPLFFCCLEMMMGQRLSSNFFFFLHSATLCLVIIYICNHNLEWYLLCSKHSSIYRRWLTLGYSNWKI